MLCLDGGDVDRDVDKRAVVEQHRKHSAEVTAVAAIDANFVVAGDRQGRLSSWQRDTSVALSHSVDRFLN